MRTLTISILAATLVAFSAGGALAKTTKKSGVTGNPPHASTTGMASRSSEAGRHGANKKGFCPPGQFKKSGKGSAFNC
jgi:hypothetical protein